MGDEFKFGKPCSTFLFSGRLARSAAESHVEGVWLKNQCL